jgi:hypothetical protein
MIISAIGIIVEFIKFMFWIREFTRGSYCITSNASLSVSCMTEHRMAR